MRCLRPFVMRLLIGLTCVAGCGGNVLVDGEGAGQGGAGGVASSGNVNGSAVNASSGAGNTSTSAGNPSSGPGSVTSTAASVTPSTVTSVSAVSVGSGGALCGMEACYPVNIQGFIDLPPCCPDANPNKCGLDVTQIASFVGFPPGCMELERPGNLDMSCPEKLLDVMGMMITLPGCCSGGMCGVFADFSGFAPGMNFGCADASDVTQSCGP